MDWIKFLRNSFKIELEIPFGFFQGYSTDSMCNVNVAMLMKMLIFFPTKRLKQIQGEILISLNANQRKM